VAGTAGTRASARPLDVNVICLGYVEQVRAVGYTEGVRLRGFVDEGNCSSVGGISVIFLVRPRGARMYSSPGLGTSRWPWEAIGVVLKRRDCADGGFRSLNFLRQGTGS
jgi:hypothetical protein